jgi:hypothetical protein
LGQYNEPPVYKATYDLLLSIFQFTRDFSREYEYTGGEILKKETTELLTLIYRANSKYQKAEILQTAREQIEVVHLLIRHMKDMKQISLEKFVKINLVVEKYQNSLQDGKKANNKKFSAGIGYAMACPSEHFKSGNLLAL